ncbi:MAG: hypothetical protein CML29_17425 [Rhizobiales bacterium]|nr:hypothetical protein [Hyphomicrobiales bacterium]MBA68637.1 hypothetical protein [Hyphomicrobiales bacterium]|tara:strand:+ start:590 stop:1240 length:651 start_codon:yes stop_codon:yes gene_type:complete
MVETVMMTLSALAERDGVSRQALSKTVRGLVDKHSDIPVERDGRGRITKVSVAHLDHYRDRYQNPAKVMAARGTGSTGRPSSGSLPERGERSATGAPARDEESYEEARRLNEWLRYQRQKLAQDEEAGKLIRADSLAQSLETIGREIQAIVARLPNQADDLSLAAAKEGIHGLRSALRKVAFDINSAIADKMAEIGASAPATEAVDDDGAEEDLTA